MYFLNDPITFSIKRNHQFKESFDLFLTLVHMNRNYIEDNYICSTPSFSKISSPLACPISEESCPQLMIGVGGMGVV